MSCCGFPPKSQEPEYPMHPSLREVALEWERHAPGVFHAIREEVGGGNWDKAVGMDVPEYSLEESFAAALARLERYLLEQETLRLYKEGSWLVRTGLSKPPKTLPAHLKERVETCTIQAHHALQHALTATPAQLQVGQSTPPRNLLTGGQAGWGVRPA